MNLYAHPPDMTEFAGRSAESKPQPCCTVLHLQCSAGQLQLGAGGKSLFSFTLAQSFAAFEESQPLCLLLMSPSFPSTVVSDFWWLFRKLLGCLQEYLYPWEAVLLAGRFPSLILSREFAALQGIRTFGRVSLDVDSHEFHRRFSILP